MANRTEPGLAAWPQRAGCMVALGSSNHFQRNPESERYCLFRVRHCFPHALEARATFGARNCFGAV